MKLEPINLQKRGLLSKIPVNLKSSKNDTKEQHHAAIFDYLNKNDIAKQLVAKWFNRSKKGGFNMSLIAQRGLYNASDLEIKISKHNERGSALLADAGEALIKNTLCDC